MDTNPPAGSVRLIGYWRNDVHPEYPDPRSLVDQAWDDGERVTVGLYLRSGMVVRGFMGYSPCRICGELNGALELTDGTYAWPEGLGHYVEEHSVRLPSEFIRHVGEQEDRLDQIEPDLTWWLEVNGDR